MFLLKNSFFYVIIYLKDIYRKDIKEKTMRKINKTRYSILGILTHKPMSGYDIKKNIEFNLKYFWNESYGQIYPTLKELELEGLVTMSSEVNEGKPEKKVYTITAKGEMSLAEWLKSPVEEENLRYEILLKTFFGSKMPASNMIKHIEDFRCRQEKKLSEIIEFEKSLRSVIDESKDHIYYLLTVLCGRNIFESYIKWCDDAIVLLNESFEREVR